MKPWVDPATGKRYMDKLEDFNYDNQKDFETRQPCGNEEAENVTLNTSRKRSASKEHIEMNSAEMIEMRRSGKTFKFIAQHFNVSDTAVRKVVGNIYHIKRMSRAEIESHDNDLIEAYKSGLTIKEVSQKLKMSFKAVNTRLHELEKLGLIEIRNTHETRKMKARAMA